MKEETSKNLIEIENENKILKENIEQLKEKFRDITEQ